MPPNGIRNRQANAQSHRGRNRTRSARSGLTSVIALTRIKGNAAVLRAYETSASHGSSHARCRDIARHYTAGS
jgi:hypothetical protein